MTAAIEPQVDEPVPPEATGEDDDDEEPGRPWWGSPWRLIVLGVALVLLGCSIGYALTNRSNSPPGASSIDVGFLQDMRWHHDQAVQMAFDMLEKPAATQDPSVRSIAQDILLSQQFENGVMAGQLRSWGQAEANESGTGMTWMNMSVPIARMPGMASDDEMDQLSKATGHDADLLFLKLMIAHHEGGLHMASYAAARAETSAVRQLATSILNGQQNEIGELTRLQTQLGGTTTG